MAQAHTGWNAVIPASRAAAITPNDSTDLSNVTTGIYVGVGGNVKVDMVYEGSVTFSNVPTGSILPVQAKRVYSTGTTATTMIALY
jgi:hypothetical protein